jgi:hypothetical protein
LARPRIGLISQVIVFIIYFFSHMISARTLGYVALQRRTADNFCLAQRAALQYSSLART